MTAPLAGVRVVDFSELLPGPFLTQTLVEMGAEVVKIERPPHGDNARLLAPGVFASINRGKASMLADLKTEAGLGEVLALVLRSDLLVESYRPGTLARYGLDYPSLRERHPRLIYASLSGYGQNGPDAQLSGHDINYLAAAGTLALTGDNTGPPQSRFPVPFADLGGSMLGLSAVLAALFQREKTGRGQHLDISITEAMLHWMTPRLAAFEDGGVAGLARQRAALTRPAYGSFACADGRYITVAALENAFWRSIVQALDLAAFAGPEYALPARRAAEAVAINSAVASALARYPADEALRLLRAADVPAMAVIEPGKLSEHPQHVARQALVATEAGMLPRYPVRLDGMPPTPRRASKLNARPGTAQS